MSKLNRLNRFILLGLVVFSACGSPDTQASNQQPLGSENVSNAGGNGSTQEETAEPTQESPESNPLLIFPWMIEMENMMPTAGIGVRPLLEWQTVEGAVMYYMLIFESDGRPYWAWRTDQTSVYVAGIDKPLPAENEGPRIVEGMTWQVTALDAAQTPIAVGGPWQIDP